MNEEIKKAKRVRHPAYTWPRKFLLKAAEGQYTPISRCVCICLGSPLHVVICQGHDTACRHIIILQRHPAFSVPPAPFLSGVDNQVSPHQQTFAVCLACRPLTRMRRRRCRRAPPQLGRIRGMSEPEVEDCWGADCSCLMRGGGTVAHAATMRDGRQLLKREAMPHLRDARCELV